MSRSACSSAWIMAAILWPLTVVAAATTHAGSAKGTEHVIHRYLIVHGDSTTGSWDDSDSSSREGLRQRFGDRFAWFRKDGHEYVITASAVLDELDRALEPQKNVNRMQAGVNREQRRVNEMQAGVNALQHDVNAMQAQVNENRGIDQGRVNRKQADVNAEQAVVNAEQAKVNAMQEKVNEEQRRVSAELRRRVDEIFHSAVQSGAARELR